MSQNLIQRIAWYPTDRVFIIWYPDGYTARVYATNKRLYKILWSFLAYKADFDGWTSVNTPKSVIFQKWETK